MSEWCVINTLPHQEARAEANLVRQGYRAWLPTFERSRRHARRIDTVRVPLFPGYIFVELDLQDELWAPINGTFGVRRLLCQRERPAIVSKNFIETLRGTIDDEGLVAIPDSELKPGQKVRIVAGPFVDCVGTLLSLTSKKRVEVLLGVLNASISTTVSRRLVAPAA